MNIDLLSSFVPEFKEYFIRRYEILQMLSQEGTVGRRTISTKLNLSERVIRDEINKLKEMELVLVSSAGVTITDSGKNIIKSFLELYREFNNLTELERTVEDILNVKKVIVVKGDVSKDEYVFESLGSATAKLIEGILQDGYKIGVTGGRTLSAIADEMSLNTKRKNLTVIPARGSLGRSVGYQSNSIASKLAQKLNAEYQILPVPDTASEEAMKMLMDNQEVKEAYEKLKNLDVLIFGVGRADVMTGRRGSSDELKGSILKSGAVAEAFGHYFNIKGEKVYHSQSIGITISEFLKIPNVIGVAGGDEKSEAIMSISTLRSDMVLVIDESAAKRIVNIRR